LCPLLKIKMTTKINKNRRLLQVKNDLTELPDSPLYLDRVKNRYLVVAGEGNSDADIVFIGEAPGKNEALCGRPFCGPSGKMLDELLTSISLKRSDVYITNIVKDRPPLNRDPDPTEIRFYARFLEEELKVIEPKIVVTLGRFSTLHILNKYQLLEKALAISELHGQRFDISTDFGEVIIMPMFHPAAAIYDRNKKQILIEDMLNLKDIYQKQSSRGL